MQHRYQLFIQSIKSLLTSQSGLHTGVTKYQINIIMHAGFKPLPRVTVTQPKLRNLFFVAESRIGHPSVAARPGFAG